MLYPNPAHQATSLEIKGNVKELTITITDITGSVKWQKEVGNPSRINLPVERLAAGVYMVIVKSGSETRTVKLVKE